MAYIGITSVADSEQLSPNYIGFQPTYQRPETAFVVDVFTGNGSDVYPLSNPKPVTSRALLVTVDGQLKVPSIDFDLDSTGNLQFVDAPAPGSYITVHHLIFPKNEATTAIRKLDDISNNFDNMTTRFTLTANGVAANILGENVLVISLDGVIQEPGEAYILDGDDIIFSEAPRNISSFYGIDVGTTGIGTPGDATVSPSKFLTDNQASTGKVLGVNSAGELSWVTVSGGVGATDLDGLSDVSLNLPMSGQVLRFNGSNFVNSKLNYSDLQGPPSLAAVATSGNYNDLTNKPVYPTDLNGFTDSTGLLFDGDYGSLTNLPNIPDHLTDLMDIDLANPGYNQVLVYDGHAWINDSLHLTDLGIVDGTAGQVLTTNGHGDFTFTTITGGSGGAPYTLPPATTSALGGVKVDGTSITITDGVISASGVTSYNDLTDTPTLFSGSYNDLTDTPTIPSDVSDLTDTTSLLFSGSYTDLTNKPALFSGSYTDLTNKPILFSGSYNDLTSKPTLFSGSYNDLTSKPTLFSGAYADLTGKPSLATSATTDTTNAANITSGTLPNARLASVPNSALANSKITLGTTDVSLGGTVTTITGLSVIGADSITVNGQPTTYGYVNSSYLFAVNNADQASVGQNGAVNFQTTSASNGSLITKTSNSRVTLKAGNTYKLKAVIGRLASSSTWAQFRWYDVTNSSYVGSEGFSEAVTSSTAGVASTNVPTAYVTPNVDTTYELRQTTANTVTVNAYASMEVTQVNPTISVQATATGTINTSYAKYTRSAQQTGATTNTVIVCNVLENVGGSAISVNTSSGQITLTAGKTYRLRGGVPGWMATSGSRPAFMWYNETGSAWIGEASQAYNPAEGAAYGATGGPAEAIFTANATTVVSFRVASASQTLALGANADWGITTGSYPWIDVQELTTSFAINTLDTMSWTTDLTTTGDVTGNTLISTNASANEGGEVQLAKAPNSTLSGSNIVIDQYVDKIRFFEGGGTTRGAYIDLTQAGAGVGTLLNNRVSGIVNAGTFVTMDNLKATVTSSGQRGLSLATVSGSNTYLIGGTYATDSSGGYSGSLSVTTTPSSSVFNWHFTGAGNISTYILTDVTNSRAYRITLQIGGSYLNNLISIERLV